MSSFRFESLGDDPTAVIAAVQRPGVSDAELASSLEELERLAKTLGLRPVGRMIQRRSRLAPGKVFGDGKLIELASWTGGSGIIEAFVKPGVNKAKARAEAEQAAEAEQDAEEADDEIAGEDDDAAAETTDTFDEDDQPNLHGVDPTAPPRAKVVLIDHQLSPSQQLNLEKCCACDVLDRTSVILEIFQRHAKTREARLQVEIARLRYLAPRLRAAGGNEDRARGGIGGKGAGETSMELDRRRIRDRIAELKGELALIEGGSKTRRARRGDLPTVALVGYTNAGKSSLMRALTGSEVYVADKLFATLDTTVRVLHPRSQPPILVSDTVGFIKKVPHDLVASFRSTLEEAGDADLLLHVLDADDAAMHAQLQVTRDVLREIGIDETQPTMLILNKADKLDADALAKRREEFPDAILMSSRSAADVAALHDRLIAHFIGAMEEADLDVPYAKHRLVSTIHEAAAVLSQTHGDTGTILRVRAPAQVIARLRAELDGQ